MSVLEQLAPLLDQVERVSAVTPRSRRRGWLVRRALALADLAGLLSAFVVAQLITAPGRGAFDPLSPGVEFGLFALTLPVWVVGAKVYGLYDLDEERADHSTADELGRVFHLVSIGTWLFFALAWFTNITNPYLPKLFLFWLLAIAAVTAGRAGVRSLCRQHPAYLQNTVIVGAARSGRLVAQKLLDHPELGLNLIGFVADMKEEDSSLPAAAPLLGAPDRLRELVTTFEVERVIIALPGPAAASIDLIRSLRGLDVQLNVVPRLFEALGPNAAIQMIDGLPVIALPPLHLSRSSLLLKRLLDVVVSGVALIVLSPVFAYIALRIKLDSRGPVFYRHRRVGRHGGDLDVVKFRTMFRETCRGDRYGGAAAEAMFEELLDDPLRRSEFDATYKLNEDPRVTRYGRILRCRSLDELPQLLNVLRGDLSLVGPRPVTQAELHHYGADVGLLMSSKPGITGYWQINGRSNLAYDERVRLDLAYVGAWSLPLDLSILAKTARVLVTRRGAT